MYVCLVRMRRDQSHITDVIHSFIRSAAFLAEARCGWRC